MESLSLNGDKSHAPGNSIRHRNILVVVFDLVRSFVMTSPDNKKSTSPIDELLYYVNRAILLTIFFFLAVYKNVQFIYRRVVLRMLTLAYYPSKTPQLIREDVSSLPKIPKRLSCILDLRDDEDENGGIDGLINDISELAAWSISAGIPQLSIYEYSGDIAHYLPTLRHYISKNLAVYFGTDTTPSFSIRVPHDNAILYSTNFSSQEIIEPERVDLHISLLSRADGKPTIVELTKTMSELALNMELSVDDITTELIEEELNTLVGYEPDLLLSFGPSLDLQDYPPWHIRLSEIYWEPDNMYVNYAVFLRSLQKYANCKVNVGK